MPDQPWDPKWPVDKPLWEPYIQDAKKELRDNGIRWGQAFAAIVKADADGHFAGPKSLYNYPDHPWPWRGALWDYCVSIFDQPLSGYAHLVYGALPKDWVKGGHGPVDGMPSTWHTGPAADTRKVLAFKATVTLIAGLVEGELPRPK